MKKLGTIKHRILSFVCVISEIIIIVIDIVVATASAAVDNVPFVF